FGSGLRDRAGRVAVSTLLLSEQVRDPWNQLDTFTASSTALSDVTIQAEFQRHLVSWDLADGLDHWDGGSPDGGVATVEAGDAGDAGDAGTIPIFPHPLVKILSNDVLIVDTTKPFSPASYLDVEFKAIAGTPGTHTTCGGRWMNDDAVDKMLSFLANRTLVGV